MKKIGILFGQENTFPQAFVDRINRKNEPGIMAEFVTIDKVMQGADSGYAVILDRISQDVPFYRAYLKNAAIGGTAVINNPFWWSADDKFFNNAVALKTGVAVPKTVLVPSRNLPENTSDQSFRNLLYPFDWDTIFAYTGFPAYMKPFAGGGWKNVYQVENREDFFNKHAETDQLVMMLQEEIVFEEYYRCYCIGGRHVRIMPYDPRHPHHLRYQASFPGEPALLDTITAQVIALNEYLGYDFNTVEMAVKEGIPYAIDFCNPAPDADLHSVGADNFEWVVETTASYAIARAKAHQPGADNLTWGRFVQEGILANGTSTPPKKKKAAAKKATTAKKAADTSKKKTTTDKKTKTTTAATTKKSSSKNK